MTIKQISFFLFLMLATIGVVNSCQSSTDLSFSIEKIIPKNDGKKIVFFKIKEAGKKLLTLNDLQKVHTQKIHLLVIDDSLEDYNHVHPVPTSTPGVYQFSWYPKKNTSYTLWLDIVPKTTQQQHYLKQRIDAKPLTSATIQRKPVTSYTKNGLTFTLSFDQKTVKVGTAVMGNIAIQDEQGKPVNYLEPVMGAYAHIVGFGDDLNTIVHIHPMGKEPQHSTDRGGPNLMFHLEATKPGFIKLFAQVKIHGKELFIPFGVIIERPTPDSRT